MSKKILLILLTASLSLYMAGCKCCPKSAKSPCPPKTPCEAAATTKTMRTYPECGPCGAVVKLEKIAPTEVIAKEPFNYQIKVTNHSDNDLHNLRVVDRLPANWTINSSDPQAMKGSGAGEYQWSLGELGPKASRMITVHAVAEGEGAMSSCAQVYYDTPTCAKIMVVEPKLRLAKSAPANSLSCDRIPLKYTVTNTGTGTACNIEVHDMLPEGMMTSDGKHELVFSTPSLGPGKSQDFVAMVDASKSGKYASSAWATTRGAGKAMSNTPETMVTQPVLAISEDGPDQQFIGRNVTYEISVANKGDGMANDTIIEASVPEGFRFESATDGGVYTHMSPGKVTWRLGTLDPDTSKKLTFTLVADQPGSISTTAKAQAHCAEAVTTSAQTKVTGIPAILLEMVDSSDPIELGQNETYVITVTNQGSMADTNIKLVCTMEDNMQYVSSTGPTAATVEGKTITFAALPSIAAKNRAVWSVVVKAVSVGDVRFKAELTSAQLTRPVDETESTNFYK